MAFAKAQGPAPAAAHRHALGKGAGSSWYFRQSRAQRGARRVPGGLPRAAARKDLRICRDMAARFGVELPVVENTLEQYARLVELGHGDDDISVLFRLKDALFAAATRNAGTPPARE